MGAIVEVMVEEYTATSVKGRTGANQVVHLAATVTDIHPGDLVMARIEHAGKHSLKGTITP